MTRLVLFLVALAASLGVLAQPGGYANRDEALKGLTAAAAEQRAEAVVWFVRNGTPADDKQLLPRLGDENPVVRELAERGMWVLWSRSGDKAVDALMEKGVEQMQARQYAASIATFTEIIKRKPEFAEGWNKRATIYFLLGRFEASLHDCDEVFKRNPQHFGALAGAGQIHLRLGDARLALEFFRRAVDVNPNLEGPAQMIPLLEEQLETADRHRT